MQSSSPLPPQSLAGARPVTLETYPARAVALEASGAIVVHRATFRDMIRRKRWLFSREGAPADHPRPQGAHGRCARRVAGRSRYELGVVSGRSSAEGSVLIACDFGASGQVGDLVAEKGDDHSAVLSIHPGGLVLRGSRTCERRVSEFRNASTRVTSGRMRGNVDLRSLGSPWLAGIQFWAGDFHRLVPPESSDLGGRLVAGISPIPADPSL